MIVSKCDLIIIPNIRCITVTWRPRSGPMSKLNKCQSSLSHGLCFCDSSQCTEKQHRYISHVFNHFQSIMFCTVFKQWKLHWECICDGQSMYNCILSIPKMSVNCKQHLLVPRWHSFVVTNSDGYLKLYIKILYWWD